MIKYWVLSGNERISFRECMKELLEVGCSASFESRFLSPMNAILALENNQDNGEIVNVAPIISNLKKELSNLDQFVEELK